MARPKKCRCVFSHPRSSYFKPRGIPLRNLEIIVLTLDECEAIRFADLEGIDQAEAAENMKISRQTFGRIVETARVKIADAIVNGKAIKIEGGEVEMMLRKFECSDCSHNWEEPFGTGRPKECPSCHGPNFCRIDSNRGYGRQRRGGMMGPCGKGRTEDNRQ